MTDILVRFSLILLLVLYLIIFFLSYDPWYISSCSLRSIALLRLSNFSFVVPSIEDRFNRFNLKVSDNTSRLSIGSIRTVIHLCVIYTGVIPKH